MAKLDIFALTRVTYNQKKIMSRFFQQFQCPSLIKRVDSPYPIDRLIELAKNRFSYLPYLQFPF